MRTGPRGPTAPAGRIAAAARAGFAALCASLTCWNATAADKPDLLWVVFDTPPLYFSSGPYEGEGMFDVLVSTYADTLTEYEHHIVPVSMARFHRLLAETDKDFCVPTMFKLPGQERTRAFGTFNVVSAPIEVLTTRENLKLFPATEAVSLAELVQDPRLIMGIAKGRSYSTLDAILEPHRSATNVIEVAVKSQETLFRMLLRGRIHYLLGLPHEVGYIGTVMDRKEAFVSLPIQEADTPFRAYPSCTNNAWGAAVIEKINAVSATPALREAYFEFIRQWTTPEAAKRVQIEHLKAFDEVYGGQNAEHLEAHRSADNSVPGAAVESPTP